MWNCAELSIAVNGVLSFEKGFLLKYIMDGGLANESYI